MGLAQCGFCEDLTLGRYGACWHLTISYSWVYNHVLILQMNHGKLPLVYFHQTNPPFQKDRYKHTS